MASSIDLPPTCRPCGQRGIITLATWVRNDHEVQNWTLCDRHAGMLGVHYATQLGSFTRLPDSAEAMSGDEAILGEVAND